MAACSWNPHRMADCGLPFLIPDPAQNCACPCPDASGDFDVVPALLAALSSDKRCFEPEAPGSPLSLRRRPRGAHLAASAGARHSAWAEICGRAFGDHARAVKASVLVFDDRTEQDSEFLRWSRAINEAYCARRGLSLRFECDPYATSVMPSYWARVDKLVRLSAELPAGPESYVIVMDSDAVFANTGFDLRRFLAALPREKSVFVAKDPAMHPPPRGSEQGVLCSAFVCVRLDDVGRGFLDAWRAAYDPECWFQDVETGSWKSTGNWAGPSYEQGQLNLLLRGVFSDAFLELPQSLFNSPFVRDEGLPQPAVVHLMRRPGEGNPAKKEHRVAATLRALWERLWHEGDADARGCWGLSGLPSNAAELVVWEAMEDVLGP